MSQRTEEVELSQMPHQCKTDSLGQIIRSLPDCKEIKSKVDSVFSDIAPFIFGLPSFCLHLTFYDHPKSPPTMFSCVNEKL